MKLISSFSNMMTSSDMYIRCAIFRFSNFVSKYLCACHINMNNFEMKKDIYEYTNLIDIYLHLLLLFCQLSVLTEVLFFIVKHE